MAHLSSYTATSTGTTVTVSRWFYADGRAENRGSGGAAPRCAKREVIVDTQENWLAAAARVVKSGLVEAEQVPASDVANAVGKTARSVANNGHEIAVLAGAWYHGGTRGRSPLVNRFTKAPLAD